VEEPIHSQQQEYQEQKILPNQLVKPSLENSLKELYLFERLLGILAMETKFDWQLAG
jgi:hypothetical protein